MDLNPYLMIRVFRPKSIKQPDSDQGSTKIPGSAALPQKTYIFRITGALIVYMFFKTSNVRKLGIKQMASS